MCKNLCKIDDKFRSFPSGYTLQILSLNVLALIYRHTLILEEYIYHLINTKIHCTKRLALVHFIFDKC